MKPILFDGSATDFNTQGLGALSDCISCFVTEERNGIYEVEFTYPITGIRYEAITAGRIILVSHDERKDLQPFIIYRISRPISGAVTVNAHHISYELNNVIVGPYEANNIGTAFNGFHDHAMTDNSFTFWTDKTSAGTFKVTAPTSVRALLGGTSGSILDAFGGGEYEFDNKTVKLYQHRGYDNGITIRYGKNLTDITAETDSGSLYNAVIPYWSNAEDTIVCGGIVQGNGGIAREETWTDERSLPIQDENGETITFRAFIREIVPMDLSGEFTEAPTVAQLESRAQTILNSNAPWIPKENIKIDFVALWQTEEYKNIAPLERVRLCDTVTVKYEKLGVDVKARVIRTVWNPLLDRYDSIEIGDAQMSFADTIAAETDMKLADIPNTSMMQKAIDHATDLITGGMGGNIVIQYDGNGKPTEILVMDTDDVSTAVHVLRINVNGIGFSSNGINGPYTSAWTLDGQFVADFITAGHMRFNILQGGKLTLGGVDDGNGILNVYDSTGNLTSYIDKTGVNINDGTIQINTNGNNYCHINKQGFELRADSTDIYTSGIIYDNFPFFDEPEVELGLLALDYDTSTIFAHLSPLNISFTHNEFGYADMYPGQMSCGNKSNTTFFAVHSVPHSGNATYAIFQNIPVNINSNLTVTGTKNRAVDTDDYGERLLYCYEMSSPMFGDIGEGVIAEDGKCYVMIDGVFSKTVTLSQYQVMLQKYGKGDCWVSERNNSYFVVEGTPGMRFAWELKAKQSDFDQRRLEENTTGIVASNHIDYAAQLENHINKIRKDREVA